MLKSSFKFDNVRKTYSNRIRFDNASSLKIEFFRILQSLLFKSSYLIHHDNQRQTFVDFDVNKKFELNVIIYHVKSFANWNDIDYSFRKSIELILFLNRLLTSAETRYWSIELKLVDIVWMFKKIKYLIDSFSLTIVIYTNHDATLEFVKQTTLIISSIDKLNLRLVLASNYIQRFNFDIRHKFDKQHIIFDVFFRLVSLNDNTKKSIDKNELDALFITILIEMKIVFRNQLLKDYFKNSTWKKIIVLLNVQKQIDTENNAILSFYREQDFIFRINDHTFDHAFQFRRLCISQSLIDEILDTFHDFVNEHSDFIKCYERMTIFYFIRDFFKQLRDYLRHCSNCQIHQSRRHKSHDFLQLILFASIFFHTLIIDFILTFLKSRDDLNVDMSITCKFIKHIICISNKSIWFVAQWIKILLNRLDIVDWEISKIIIFDKDRKFMFKLWIELFRQLNVKLLYFTAYHSQIDDQSKRTNQILKIAFRFAIVTLDNSIDWSDVTFRIQRTLNNSIVNIDKTFNEISYHHDISFSIWDASSRHDWHDCTISEDFFYLLTIESLSFSSRTIELSKSSSRVRCLIMKFMKHFRDVAMLEIVHFVRDVLFFFASSQASLVVTTSLLTSKQYCTCDNFCFLWNHQHCRRSHRLKSCMSWKYERHQLTFKVLESLKAQ